MLRCVATCPGRAVAALIIAPQTGHACARTHTSTSTRAREHAHKHTHVHPHFTHSKRWADLWAQRWGSGEWPGEGHQRDVARRRQAPQPVRTTARTCNRQREGCTMQQTTKLETCNRQWHATRSARARNTPYAACLIQRATCHTARRRNDRENPRARTHAHTRARARSHEHFLSLFAPPPSRSLSLDAHTNTHTHTHTHTSSPSSHCLRRAHRAARCARTHAHRVAGTWPRWSSLCRTMQTWPSRPRSGLRWRTRPPLAGVNAHARAHAATCRPWAGLP
jgi:hypothetical protein